MINFKQQHTITKSISFKGIGLHSGDVVDVKLKPMPVDSGITFCRMDLSDKPIIKSSSSAINPTPLCTTLFDNHGNYVSTVEHLMAAFSAYGISNIQVELSSAEIPILDGSAMPWLILLDEAGVKAQAKSRKYIKVKKHVRIEEDNKWVELKPSNGQTINFNIDFDHPAIAESASTYSFHLSPRSFITISRSRTFGFINDIEKLRENGLALGGSMDNAIVLDQYKVLNPDGLRHPDEFVMHKVLDAVGDFYAEGIHLHGEITAYRSGHALNNKILVSLLSDPDNYDVLEHQDLDIFENNTCSTDFNLCPN